MAKGKKKSSRRAASKAPSSPAPFLAPQVLEEAAQGWLQSARPAPSSPRPQPSQAEHRLTQALSETLHDLRAEISELRVRLDRLEKR